MKLSLLLFSLLVIGCQTTESNPNKQELLHAIDLFNDTFKSGDTASLGTMITDDYTHTNGSWKSFGKDKWLEYMTAREKKLQSGDLLIDQYAMDELETTLFGNNAITTARIIVSGVEDNKPFLKKFRVTNIWVYKQSKWLRAGFHDTLID